jgi:hypothetical protein
VDATLEQSGNTFQIGQAGQGGQGAEGPFDITNGADGLAVEVYRAEAADQF